jgi:hypothetical protein
VRITGNAVEIRTRYLQPPHQLAQHVIRTYYLSTLRNLKQSLTKNSKQFINVGSDVSTTILSLDSGLLGCCAEYSSGCRHAASIFNPAQQPRRPASKNTLLPFTAIINSTAACTGPTVVAKMTRRTNASC